MRGGWGVKGREEGAAGLPVLQGESESAVSDTGVTGERLPREKAPRVDTERGVRERTFSKPMTAAFSRKH